MARFVTLFQGTGVIPSTTNEQYDAGPYQWVTLVAKGLAAADVVTLDIGGVGGWEALRDASGNAMTLTGSGGTPANRTMLTVDGGLPIRVSGTMAGAAVTILVVPGPSMGQR